MVATKAEKGDLRTRLEKPAEDSTLLYGEKDVLEEEVRKLCAERAHLMAETVEARKQAEADRVSVRSEIDEFRQEVTDTSEARDGAVTARKEQRLDDLDGMEKAVSEMFNYQKDLLRSGLQAIFCSEVDSSSTPAGTFDGPVKSLAAEVVDVVDGTDGADL